MSFGAATGGAINTAGTLAITTDGGVGAAGEIQITSSEALSLGVLNTDDATAQDVSISVTGDNATLLVTAASALDSDVVTFTADEMNIGSTVTTTGIVTLQTNEAGEQIDLGSAGSTVNDILELSDTELGNIRTTTLRVGRANAG
ncbi:MAG: Outer membrane adhesin like protein, partial [Gammaproteobacteria bacterium]